MKQQFNIGGFLFELCSQSDLIIPAMFQKFAAENHSEETEYQFVIIETDSLTELPEKTDSVLTRKSDIVVGTSPAGEYRLIGINGVEGYYASYREIEEKQAEIYLRSDYRHMLVYDTVFTSLFALERHMMKKNQFILHCSFVEYQKEAILFSAPSETGKTTQANLWEKYRGSRTVNGDRALLFFKEDRLYAGGWPVCGSSEICENEQYPVKAIVILSQGKENKIRQITGREAFLQLYSQLTINSWNPDFVNRGIDFIERILAEIPVYHLSCTISEEAVILTDKTLAFT